ncbi:hypothetical protein COTS27_01489 [Spirochaetota bacterium]|nr:hypothetical protein COTS27_01489 [Spirochaetota bacterium]
MPPANMNMKKLNLRDENLTGLSSRTLNVMNAVKDHYDIQRNELRQTIFFYKRRKSHLFKINSKADLRDFFLRAAFLTSYALKRLLDISIALILIIALIPITITFMFLVSMEGSGCAFYGKKCIGQDGELFRMYRFRTQRTTSTYNLLPLFMTHETTGIKEKIFRVSEQRDLTFIGKILVFTRLEMIPVLFNVLLGDMSLLGPHPIAANQTFNYTLTDRMRLHLKPGLAYLRSSALNHYDTTSKTPQAKKNHLAAMLHPDSSLDKDMRSFVVRDRYGYFDLKHIRNLTWANYTIVLMKISFFIMIGKAIY